MAYEYIIDCQRVTKVFNIIGSDEKIYVLNGVDLQVQRAEYVIIFGPSGCGKSSLLNLIAGLEKPDSGSIKIRGQDITHLTKKEMATHHRVKVGMVFQQFNLLPNLNAIENIALSQVFGGVRLLKRLKRAHHLLDRFNLEKLAKKIPMEMSGGEQQHIAICRALVNNPWILLVDEPTGDLDQKSGDEVMDLMLKLNEQGKRTIITIEEIAGDEALSTLEIKPYGEAAEKILNQDAVNKISQIEGVEKVEPVVSFPSIQMGFKSDKDQFFSSVNIYSVNPDYFKLHGLTISQGKSFDKDASDQIVVSEQVSGNLAVQPKDLIDKEVDIFLGSIDGYPLDDDKPQGFKVVGVAYENENTVYLPLSLLGGYVKDDSYNNLKVKVSVPAGEDPNERVEKVKNKLAELGYSAEATIDNVSQIKSGFRVLTIILGVFGLIALLVATIGMFNTMTVSLLERIREVGIMKAIGAAEGDIWRLFVVEASMIGFFGGIGGLIIGMAAGGIVNLAYNALAFHNSAPTLGLFYTPLWFVIFILTFAAFIGFLTGIYPARRAAHLNPLRALRYE
ncbi:MAG: ABC-type antimicrobial peptide transport system, ATPase component [Candidatus Berkelbacteria bacterium Licking1014_2]|uniref:ABC-type antimicrobial peptide transport system, ATPase component n=1 Tax=Candidatus Berkelbacteria bacterium Licking1014_2 TaxID=2017146 RepID=A0A554LS43_9BACT|nr:MAG: ABC-type antimicrobial peptide transport system, ATPase component [Candidatus Berkelbacteria bacterium Licking1014_2]